jgi:cytochrome d ubiquinol oxidase subunit II
VTLPELWFILIAALWTAYLVLEGFDFGVGMLLPVLARDESDRRTMFESIGPVWDGNEVWLVIAAAATFAAFPRWYATLFSGFYIALLLILLLLIVRVVSFEWRSKVERIGWRALWTWLNFAGALGVPLLWGLILSTILRGVPVSSSLDYRGSITDLTSLYSIVGAIALVLLCVLHGAGYLVLRTDGGLNQRAQILAARLSPVVLVIVSAFLIWTVSTGLQQGGRGIFPGVLPVGIGGLAMIGAVIFNRTGRAATAFASTAVAIGALVAALFVELYPRLIVSAPNPANTLTIQNSASSQYTLTVMTVAIVVLLPLVLVYQAASYRVFRARIQKQPLGSTADVLLPKSSKRRAVE